ncbi:MAG: MFS transporter [Candidatus Obscuribacterales bacterium]|nr:MFS transporter [Candidatus Obscuribacterales bacterium]
MSVEQEIKAEPFFVILDANSQKIFWGQLISQSCDKLMSVGMIWVLTERFSPKWIPWYIALGALPHFLLATKSGHLIGKWGALPTVIWTDLLRGVFFLAISAMVPLCGSDDQLLQMLMVAALISNVAGALFNPAILSLPVAMMEASSYRDKLTALIDSCFSFGNVLGPLISALSYAWVGLSGILAINGLSYLFSAILALTIKLTAKNDETISRIEPGAEPEENDKKTPVAKSISQVLKSQPVISGMLLTFLFMNFFLAPLMIFMPWYAKNVYGDGIAGLAKLEFCLGIGTVAGSILLSFVKLPGSTWKRISASLSLMALAYLSFTFSSSLWPACLSVMVLGFFLALANVIILTFFQNTPEAQDVPVVMGMVNLISVASLPISMGVIGSFVEHVAVPGFATICAAIVIGIAVLIPFIPGIRRI